MWPTFLGIYSHTSPSSNLTLPLPSHSRVHIMFRIISRSCSLPSTASATWSCSALPLPRPPCFVSSLPTIPLGDIFETAVGWHSVLPAPSRLSFTAVVQHVSRLVARTLWYPTRSSLLSYLWTISSLSGSFCFSSSVISCWKVAIFSTSTMCPCWALLHSGLCPAFVDISRLVRRRFWPDWMFGQTARATM